MTAPHPLFPHVFQPLKLRHKTLKNRIVFGAHTANMSEGGLPGERHLGYYRERARGGAAMIVVEPIPVHATAVLTRGNFLHGTDAVISGFRRITETCHEHGTVMIHQLYHVGQHGDADVSFQPNWSPSGLPSYHDADGSHAMSEAEIEESIEGFVAAAIRAQASGFDGIELFAAYHALIDQFWTPWSNRRDDRWGGSLENRVRFSAEITTRIRKAVGEDFIIGLAVNLMPEIPVSLSIEAMQEILAWHDARGLMDYVTCGTGSYFDSSKLIPSSFEDPLLGVPYAQAIKQAVRHAKVQAESHIRTPANVEAAVAAGQADLCSLVRAQIADPHLVRKAEEGRPEDVRPCISCNQLCWGRRSRDYWISCLVNPSAGREFEWGGDAAAPTSQPKRVLVVGGGLAGLEAARVAAERGHKVTLMERGPELGGQWRLAARQPHRTQLAEHLAWYRTQLEKLQVELRLGSEATAADAAGYDAVIAATGALPDASGFQRALPQQDRLPGAEQAGVTTIYAVLEGTAQLGRRVLLLDERSAWPGAGTALLMAQRGHEVTVVTADAMVAKAIDVHRPGKRLRQALAKAGARLLTEVALLSWDNGKASFRSLLDGHSFQESFDSLVLATLPRAETALAAALRKQGLTPLEAGDCVAPRQAWNAIYEARKLALSL